VKKTKLERAVERLERCLAQYDPEDLLAVVPDDLRTVLAAVKARAPSAVTRAERAVVRQARVVAAPGDGELSQESFDQLAKVVARLEREYAKAKKARRP
jgi:hypothetical protein